MCIRDSHDPLIDPSTTVGTSKLKKLLEKKISPTSKIIVISGMYAAYSEGIDFEIDTSVSKGKYIIGLKPWGQERIPVKIQNNADIMVGWNKSSVINAIPVSYTHLDVYKRQTYTRPRVIVSIGAVASLLSL